MSTTAPGTPVQRNHDCQTPDCPNQVSVVTIRLDDMETTALCEACNLTFNLAVLQKAAELGVITPGGPPA
jgi:transcription elongation factor Elf1